MVSLLTSAMLPATARATTISTAEAAEVDRIAQEALAASGAPSASVAVVRGGEIVFARAYGLRGLSPVDPATVETRYDAGSVVKQFTAAAVLALSEEGALSLDDPVGRWFPRLTGADQITLRRLLSHTAGYRNYWTVDYVTPEMTRSVEPQAIIDRWGTAPLDFEPGAQWHYTNTGYVIAGRILELTTGRPLEAILRDKIFAPLGMTSAGGHERRTPTDAEGYTRFVLGPARPATPPAPGWSYAAGGLSMTAFDLAKWDVSVIDRSLLRSSSYDAQQTEVKLSDGSGSGYGLGVYLDQVRGRRRVSHDGAAMGFVTQNRIYPDDRAALVVMVNADYGTAAHTIAEALEAMLLPRAVVQDVQADAAPRPVGVSGPDNEESRLARILYDQLRQGRLDRERLTANANAYFSEAVLSDYRDSLSRLGDPASFVQRRADPIDGLAASLYVVTWPDRILIAVLRLTPEGKVEQFTMFSPD